MADNIKVAVRVRPDKQASHCIDIHGNQVIATYPSKSQRDDKTSFVYDYVFGSNSTQADVFNELGTSVVSNALKGMT